MTRLAIIADVHGNLAALEAVLADIGRQGASAVVNLGDHVSGPLWPAETVAFLMRQPWLQIAGNHERQLTTLDPARHGASDRYAYARLSSAQLDWLRALPAQAFPRDDVFAFHGSPSSDLTYLLETVAFGRSRLAGEDEIVARLGSQATPLRLCGHTHLARAVVVRERELIVNPGSVGLPAYADDTPEPHVMESGSPHARYALVDDERGAWQVALQVVPYDHAAAARQAARNDRPDWAAALLTGRMPG